MPEITFTNLRHWCVVWQKSAQKTRYGQAKLSSPTNVRCRWVSTENSAVSQNMNNEAETIQIPIGQEVPIGSYVWGPGKIADLPSSPTYYEVVYIAKTPDLKGRHHAYVASLQKASGTLAEVTS